MKTPGMSIQIPNPCHEPWEGMQPSGNGRFCGSCQKTVIDFTGKSDVEIRDLLLSQAGQKVCGHFKKTQVNRPLQLGFPQVSPNVMPRKVFAMALLFVFGTSLVSCYDYQGKKISGIEVNTSLTGLSLKDVLGEVMPPNNTPEDTIPAKTATVLLPPIDEPEMRGDVVVIPDIQGKIEFVPEPDDSLQTGKIKNCPPDSVAKPDDSHLHMVGMVRMPDIFLPDTVSSETHTPETEEPKMDSTSSRNLKIAEVNISENGLSIFPNPSGGTFTVQYLVSTPADVRLDVFDAAGNFIINLVNIRSQHNGDYRIPVDLSHKAAGVYVVVLMQNGKRSSARFILAK